MGSTTTQDRPGTRDCAPVRIAFRFDDSVGVPIAIFRSSIPSPSIPLFTLRRTLHSARRKTRGRADRYSFLVRRLHPLLHAGLSRRTVNYFSRHGNSNCRRTHPRGAVGSRSNWIIKPPVPGYTLPFSVRVSLQLDSPDLQLYRPRTDQSQLFPGKICFLLNRLAAGPRSAPTASPLSCSTEARFDLGPPSPVSASCSASCRANSVSRRLT